ncbi:hypothetical protein OAL71_00025 [Phycisphaerales bacterium]|nr:hypothetical protein [Phycisphaerales bacterium]
MNGRLAAMTVWRQSGLVWLGALIAAGMALLAQVLLARHFDAALFGAISYAYAIAILVSTFGFQGIGEVAIRHGGRLDAMQCLRTAVVLFATATIGAVVWILAVGSPDSEPVLLTLFFPFAIIQIGMIAGMIAFQIERHTIGIALWPAGFQGARLAVVIAIVSLGGIAILVPIGWTIALIPMAIFGLRRLKRVGKWSTGARDASPPSVTRSAFPFSTTRVLEFAEIQMPIVLALPLLGDAETGRIAASLAIIQGFLLLPIAIFQRLLRPRFHEWAREDPDRLRRIALIGTSSMLAIGAGLGLLTRPFSSDLLAGLFGSDFAPASSFLDSVLLVLPIWFASIAINSTLVSHRLADLRLGTQVIAVGILIVTPLVMSSALGSNGIIWGMIGCQGFLLVSGVTLLLFGQTKD